MVICELPMCSESVYLYALLDSRNCDIRYIGSTKNPVSRYKQHLQSQKSVEFVDWWINVEGFGGTVVMFVFFETNEREREHDEQIAIDTAIARGCKLFNIRGTNRKMTGPYAYVIDPPVKEKPPVPVVVDLPVMHRIVNAPLYTGSKELTYALPGGLSPKMINLGYKGR